MNNIDFNDLGLTEKQLIKKYGKELTKQILNNKFLDHATVAVNEKGESVFYFIDIKYALDDINGKKNSYWD